MISKQIDEPAKYSVTIDNAQGVVVGDYATVQHHYYYHSSTSGNLPGDVPRPALVPVPIAPRYALETLNAASQQLARLPLDTIPELAPLPGGSRMPWRRNPLFVGRQAEMQRMARVFKGSEPGRERNVPTLVLAGIGGVGKTQLAIEFAHRYGQYFGSGIFWLNFTNPGAVGVEMAACGGIEGLALQSDFEGLSQHDQIRVVEAAFRSEMPRLLVLDNCEDPDLLDRWRPQWGGCKVLVTSRRASWDPSLDIDVLNLTELARSESIALLQHYRPDLQPENDELDALSEVVGDLPLALHVAGSHLARFRTSITLQDYLDEFRRSQPAHPAFPYDGLASPTSHDHSIVRTFALSYDRLRTDDPVDQMAVSLLQRAACFAAAVPIPNDTLVAFETTSDTGARRMAETGLHRLTEVGLLEQCSANEWRMHRLVAEFVRSKTTDPDPLSRAENAVLQASRDLEGSAEPSHLFDRLRPHLSWLTNGALQRQDEMGASLATSLGYHLNIAGEYGEAESYLRQAIALRERSLDNQHPDLAESMFNLVYTLISTGMYEEAEEYNERALAIRLAHFGEYDRATVESLNNSGVLLTAQGRLDEAQTIFERVLALPDAAANLPPWLWLNTVINLAGVLIWRGQYTIAIEKLDLALVYARDTIGERHHITAGLWDELGLAQLMAGKYHAAQVSLEQALALLKRTLGSSHPQMVNCLLHLGDLHLAKGDFPKARSYFEDAFSTSETGYGNEHPNTAVVMAELGLVLAMQRDYERAKALLERALDIQENVLDENHPGIAYTLFVFGMISDYRGDFARAGEDLRDATASSEHSLGTDHPTTRACRKMRNAAERAVPGFFIYGVLLGVLSLCTVSIMPQSFLGWGAGILGMTLFLSISKIRGARDGELIMGFFTGMSGIWLALLLSDWLNDQITWNNYPVLVAVGGFCGAVAGLTRYRYAFSSNMSFAIWGAIAGAMMSNLLELTVIQGAAVCSMLALLAVIIGSGFNRGFLRARYGWYRLNEMINPGKVRSLANKAGNRGKDA